nr:hypothetical protein [Tanacetum cinerariifolium]
NDCKLIQIGTCGENSYPLCNLCRHSCGTTRDAWVIASHPCPVCDRPPLLQTLYPCHALEVNGSRNEMCCVKAGNAIDLFDRPVIESAQPMQMKMY